MSDLIVLNRSRDFGHGFLIYRRSVALPQRGGAIGANGAFARRDRLKTPPGSARHLTSGMSRKTLPNPVAFGQ